jgi:photosystem II stability/assembly factor-like uncharacterized protein
MTPLRRGAFGFLAFAIAAVGCHDSHFEPGAASGEIDLYDDLYAVAVPDENTTVAVGYRAAVYRSEDAGQTWRKAAVKGIDPNLLMYDISMADSERGWIVGQLGTVLYTRDGGKTWEPQPNPKSDDGFHIFSVHAIDANNAWAVGEWGTRIYTTDGGASWQDSSLTITTDHPQYVWLTQQEQERVRNGEMVVEDVGLNDVSCRPAPSTRCWMVGEFGYIFWSDDRGRNWQRAEIVGTAKADPVVFSFDESEISDADAERIQAFVEGILTQQHLNVLLEAFASPQEVRAFGKQEDPTGLFDILDARAVGVRAIVEETGILSDRLRLRGTPPWDYEDFLEDDPTFLDRYLDGRGAPQGMVRVDIAQNPYLFRVRFADDMNGIISGLGGVVLTSDDGGVTWRYGDSGVKQALYALAVRDGKSLAVGEKGLVRESTDGGRTWSAPSSSDMPEVFTFMRDLRFDPSGEVGTIVGQRGLVMRSDDAGSTWTKVLPKPKVASADTGH